MPLYITWEQIAVRIALACVASMLIGVNRDERGLPAGMRTIMLVTLTATLAMLQVNVLLPQVGRGPGSFNTLDLMRLPLGILSGIGFIGAGAIIKKENGAMGVTTAATLWFSTMLGLLFGGGQLRLGIVATVIALVVLTVLRHVEDWLPRSHRGSLTLELGNGAPSEESLRERILRDSFDIQSWTVQYKPASQLVLLHAEIAWRGSVRRTPEIPKHLAELRSLPGIEGFHWEQQ